MRVLAVALAVLVCAMVPESSSAQFFFSPGCDDVAGGGSGACPPWGATRIPGAPFGIVGLSADGSTVVGVNATATQAFHWRIDQGLTFLTIPDATRVEVPDDRQAISANGNIIVGEVDLTTSSDTQIFRWDVAGDTYEILPGGPATEVTRVDGATGTFTVLPSRSPSVSGDGSVVVGRGPAERSGGGATIDDWPFEWRAGVGTSDSPQLPFDRQFMVHSVSGDGLTIIGEIDQPPPNALPPFSVRNVNGVAETILMDFSGPSAIAWDGTAIAGDQNTPPFDGYRWIQGFSGVSGLMRTGLLPRSISDNGRRVTSLDRAWIQPSAPTGRAYVFDADAIDSLLFAVPFADFFGQDAFAYGVPAPPSSATSDRLSAGLMSGDGFRFSQVGSNSIVNVSPLEVVSLGDSVASGEGAINGFSFDVSSSYEPGTDVRLPPSARNLCHQSRIAYSSLMKAPSASRTFRSYAAPIIARPGFDWTNLACSGAKVENVSRNGTPKWSTAGPQLDSPAVTSNTDLITIMIGANDAFFFNFLLSCLSPGGCLGETALNTAETWEVFLPNQIRNVIGVKLKNLYDDIKLAAPNATVVVVGYPTLFGDDSGKPASCLNTIGLNEDELEFAQAATIELNNTIASAARESGVHFVPIAQQFRRHGVCSSSPWIYGLDLIPKGNILTVKRSLHPNPAGHDQIAATVSRYIASLKTEYQHGFFESGMPKNPPPVP